MFLGIEVITNILKSISVIDVLFVISIVLGLIFGLFGKASKKIWHLIITVVCVAIAYFTCGIVTNVVLELDSGFIPSVGKSGTTVIALVTELINNAVSSMNLDASSFTPMIGGLLKMIIFWLEAIVLLLTLGLLLRFIVGIATHRKKKHTAIKTIGIPAVLRKAVLFTTLMFPVIAIAPLAVSLKDVDAVTKDQDGNPTAAAVIIEQFEDSKFIQFTTEFLEKVTIEPLSYETEVTNDDGTTSTKKQSLYEDFTSISKLLSLASILPIGDSGDDSSMLNSILEMDDDQLKDAFVAIEEVPALKSAVTGLLTSILPEDSGIDVSTIDFAEEADTFIAVKSFVEVNTETGEVQAKDLSSMSDEELADTAGKLANSDLVETLVTSETLPAGSLEVLPEAAKDEIRDVAAERLANNEIDQATYDKYLALLVAASSDDSSDQGTGDSTDPGTGDSTDPGTGDSKE